jgi:heme-degrading monooxygenase HmoA
MIARIWSGVVAEADSEAYARYVQETGIAAYRSTPGNLGAFLLRRPTDAGVRFVTVSLWSSMEAVRDFAGDDPEVAVFYPDDDRFLIERDLTVEHLEVVDAVGLAGA